MTTMCQKNSGQVPCGGPGPSYPSTGRSWLPYPSQNTRYYAQAPLSFRVKFFRCLRQQNSSRSARYAFVVSPTGGLSPQRMTDGDASSSTRTP